VRGMTHTFSRVAFLRMSSSSWVRDGESSSDVNSLSAWVGVEEPVILHVVCGSVSCGSDEAVK
jgi:hypothetical protein